jgi:uncharacterized membrane protein YadS
MGSGCLGWSDGSVFRINLTDRLSSGGIRWEEKRLCAIPMLILEPLVAKVVGMLPAVAGAWIGGTIDTTGAVVAAGAVAGPEAMAVAVVVKMAQNVLIGLVAFLLAIWFAFKNGHPGAMRIRNPRPR